MRRLLAALHRVPEADLSGVMVVVAFLLGLAAASVDGLLQEVVNGDATGIVVWVVAGLAMFGTVAAWTDRSWLDVICVEGVALMVGFLGTMIGFMGAIEGVVGSDSAAKLSGVSTALTTTVAGAVVHLYLVVLRKATDHHER